MICAAAVFALSPPDPPFNDIQSMGVSGVDFSRAGNKVQIALFMVNSNSATGFVVTFTFANGCKFTSGSKEIPMTELYLNKVSGTIGTGLTDAANIDVLHDLTGNQYFWRPGISQTTATVNYIVDLRASWNDPVRILAGFYFEHIQATIAACL